MNTINNKRRRNSQDKIEKAFIELLQSQELDEISITDIVKLAQVNRSTFYANYLDIYDLADKMKEKMFHDCIELYQEEKRVGKHSYNYLPMFEDIKNNQIFYKTLFKLKFNFTNYYDLHLETDEMLKYYDDIANMDYHIEFFKAGMTAIIKKWLDNGCLESPQEMVQILIDEYKGRPVNM